MSEFKVGDLVRYKGTSTIGEPIVYINDRNDLCVIEVRSNSDIYVALLSSLETDEEAKKYKKITKRCNVFSGVTVYNTNRDMGTVLSTTSNSVDNLICAVEFYAEMGVYFAILESTDLYKKIEE